MDKQFQDYLLRANQEFSGWDFSYITGTGRMGSQLLSWSYGSMAVPLVRKAISLGYGNRRRRDLGQVKSSS